MRTRTAAAVSLVLALVAADAADAATARLKAFSSCKALVGYARDGAARTRGGVGVVGRAVPAPPISIATPPIAPPSQVGAAPVAAAPEATSDGAVPEFSGTNTQEIGVDEPDVIKTDGRRIFAVTDRTLRVIDPATSTVTGTLELSGEGHRILLRGDRVLVIASRGAAPDQLVSRPVAPPADATPNAITVVTELDVSGAPKVLRTMDVPGRFVDARQNGATVRLVIDSVPNPIAQPQTASLSRFLRSTVLKSSISGRTFKRRLAPCRAVTHPRQFSGLDLLAILTIDLDRGMYSLDRDGVLAGAQVVYGSGSSLYVASRRYVRAVELGTGEPDGIRTEIHRFDISDPARTVYRATGTVPGFILNNYALSEYAGHLRVASTEQPPWRAGSVDATNRVTVLRQQGAKLNQVGAVSGLAPGERIYAVRFMGDRGYVVTFVQELGDPLFTLDLSDPERPRVAGELHLPGYSAYLHPVGEHQLLGIGRENQIINPDVKASLFDVSDPAAPKEVARLTWPSSSTALEDEPHAFLYWAPSRLAVLPLLTFGEPTFLGAVAVRVDADALTEAGRITHGDGLGSVERSLVIGDKLYSLSYLGLSTVSVDTLAPVGFTAFL